jgi:hypothetical protein
MHACPLSQTWNISFQRKFFLCTRHLTNAAMQRLTRMCYTPVLQNESFSYESQINKNLQQLHVYTYIYMLAVYTMRFRHRESDYDVLYQIYNSPYIKRFGKKHASVSSLFPRVLLFASRVCCTDRFGTTVCTSLVLLH